jgi:hypothetical protein
MIPKTIEFSTTGFESTPSSQTDGNSIEYGWSVTDVATQVSKKHALCPVCSDQHGQPVYASTLKRLNDKLT